MKILYITTIGSTMDFFRTFIAQLIKDGNTVDIATNENEKKVSAEYRRLGCKVYPISCSRSPAKVGNLKAVEQIHRIVKENSYELVHCHTPIAAMCTRLACRTLRKCGVKVIYTAHGFHFYKGAPLKNWMIYYPVEKLCAHWTDVLITMNREDYRLAQRKMKAGCTEYIPGIGIDIGKFTGAKEDICAARLECGIPEDAFLLLSVGELNKNKNHKTVFKAIEQLHNKKLHYAIAGEGQLRSELLDFAEKLGIGEQVHLLGFRNDVEKLHKIADILIHPSFREGLPLSVMEAMASGLPVIASDIRGNRDLLQETRECLCPPNDACAFAEAINRLYRDADLRRRIRSLNSRYVLQFAQENVNKKLYKIYTEL